jgi:hypothetical protein
VCVCVYMLLLDITKGYELYVCACVCVCVYMLLLDITHMHMHITHNL